MSEVLCYSYHVISYVQSDIIGHSSNTRGRPLSFFLLVFLLRILKKRSKHKVFVSKSSRLSLPIFKRGSVTLCFIPSKIHVYPIQKGFLGPNHHRTCRPSVDVLFGNTYVFSQIHVFRPTNLIIITKFKTEYSSPVIVVVRVVRPRVRRFDRETDF